MSPEEAKSEYVRQMGLQLGTQFAALWQEMAYLHQKWGEYVALFGSKPSRVSILNESAGSFFGMLQKVLWEDTLLHIARLTDPPQSGRDRNNLTLLNLPRLVEHQETKEKVNALIPSVLAHTSFCRDWRNRLIAHRDLEIALQVPAVPLELGSRKQVKEALSEMVNIMDAVELHYAKTATMYGGWPDPPGGAVELLYVLDDGLKHEIERRERRKRNEQREDDDAIRDL